jgi:hypothetical protein
MASVTYKNQPGIDKTKGCIPLAGTKHLYTVSKVLWHPEIEDFLKTLFIGRTLHVCCGKSKLGDVRLDLNEPTADIKCDAQDMREFVKDNEYDTVLCDPPYNGDFQWNHNLLSELARVSSKRLIFQHWFVPATPKGLYKKAENKFHLVDVYVWQPRTYFGRAQLISVFDFTAISPLLQYQ